MAVRHCKCNFHFLIAACAMSAMANASTIRAQPVQDIAIETRTMLRELRTDYCWFHPRVAAIPAAGKAGGPAVIATIQKHLAADDHYSGLYYLRTDDLGASWQGPIEIPELAWSTEPGNVHVAVADVTPGWHAPTGSMLAIGTKVRYSQKGEHLLNKPRSHECGYATFNPRTGRWTPWRFLQLPETTNRFFLVAPGCVQWLVEPNGELLIPIYFRGPKGSDFKSTVLRCRFDGDELSYLSHGDELAMVGGRGYCEPSMVACAGKYYLTLRNDARGYVTSSADGQRFDKPKPWQFDDGAELGSYNTQQHWLAENGRLYLAYTRRGANNDHIPRNRAPIFVAEVDKETLRVVRKSERVAIPERGAMLGNFGAARIRSGEWWITDSEFILADKPHPRGADGSTFWARVLFAN